MQISIIRDRFIRFSPIFSIFRTDFRIDIPKSVNVLVFIVNRYFIARTFINEVITFQRVIVMR